MQTNWTIQDAQNSLPEIVKAACNGQTQIICGAGNEKAVLISNATWQHVKHPQTEKETVIPMSDDNLTFGNSAGISSDTVKSKSPTEKNFIEFLLSMPQGDWKDEPAKDALKMRDVDF